MKAPPKAGYFLLEGLNSFASAFFFNHLLFHLRDHHGYTQLRTLWLLAAFGASYAGCSVVGGRFSQRFGYFTSLTLGFSGLIVSLAVGWAWQALAGQLVSVAIWSVAICFTWAPLEALCSEFETPERLPDRLGLYNIVWSILQALGVAAGGIAVTIWGPKTLYVIPIITYAIQLAFLPILHRQRIRYLEAFHGGVFKPSAHPAGGPEHFQTLAWIANPLAYMAANVLTASLPALSQRLHLSQAEAGVWLGVWTWIRSVGFLALWYWTGWHYRFGLFVAGFVAIVSGFLAVMLAPSVAVAVAAQCALGLGIALVYYSSIFYAMDGSDSHGEQGGTHEALIGLGLGGGPALTALALVWSGSPSSAVVATTALMSSGIIGIGWVHRSERRRHCLSVGPQTSVSASTSETEAH